MAMKIRRFIIGRIGTTLNAGSADAEAGLPDYDFKVWHGLYGPAGMEPTIVNRIHEVTTEILQMPEVKDRLHTAGMQAEPSGSVQEFNDFVRVVARDTVDLAKAVKAYE